MGTYRLERVVGTYRLERVVGTCRLTAHSFVAIRLFVGLIVFTPGTLLNIYVLLIPVISEHWTDIGAAGWLLLLIYGMGSQLI